jgi:GT2 family glycosyltransferase
MTAAVTVVVPAYDDAERVVSLLDALAVANADQEPLPVVVVDDASPALLEQTLARHTFPGLELSVVRNDSNLGPGASRNRGAAEAETPWIAFLDSDELPEPSWLPRLRKRLSQPDPPDLIKGRVNVGNEPATPFTHLSEVRGWQHPGGNVVYRAEAFRRAGGFSEAYYDPSRRLHFREDTELHFRFEELGLKVDFDQDLVALHPPGRSSFGVPLREARRYFFDPLLSREHPDRFRRFVTARRAGPVPLRWARHYAAASFVLGVALLLVGLLAGSGVVVAVASVLVVGGWVATATALAWRRKVRMLDLVPLAVASALVPWIYLWHYYRGVIRFRHRPRLL